MTVLFFLQLIAAVFLGTVMAGFFLKAVMHGERLQKQGIAANRLPFRVYLFASAPPLFVGSMIYLLS